MILSKANIQKKVKLITAVFLIVMISACAANQTIKVQPLPTVGIESKASSSVDWEQVSRNQRVLGTITDILISEGTVQSIDLKVKQNVLLINNPVDYDYMDQTLHLVMDEKVTAAGSFQDKLKKGSTFLVSFAQFSIPPKGEIVLASRFSNNSFFYEHDGIFTDKEGNPFNLETEREAANPTTKPMPTTVKKILYSLDENQLSKSFTQIPYYQQGKSKILPELVFKQFDEGHQPWLSDPVTVALVNCSNLISSEKVDVLQNKSTGNEKKIILDPDRIITLISNKESDVKVQMTKPGGISYEITMYAPKGTEVLFVKQIIETTPSK